MPLGFKTAAQAILKLLPASRTVGPPPGGGNRPAEIIGLSIFRDKDSKMPRLFLTTYHPQTGFGELPPTNSLPSWSRTGQEEPHLPYGIDDADFDFAFFSKEALRVVCNVSNEVVLSAAAIRFHTYFLRQAPNPGRNPAGFTFKLEGDIVRNPYPRGSADSPARRRGLVPVTALGLPCPPHWDTMLQLLPSIDETALQEVGYESQEGLRLLYAQWEKLMQPASLEPAPFAEVNLLHLQSHIQAVGSEAQQETLHAYATEMDALQAGVWAKSSEDLLTPGFNEMLQELKSKHKLLGAPLNQYLETIQYQLQAAK